MRERAHLFLKVSFLAWEVQSSPWQIPPLSHYMLSTLVGEREERISYSLLNTNLSLPHHFQLHVHVHVHTVLLCAPYSLSWTCSTNIETPKDHNKYFRWTFLIYMYCVSYHFISAIHFSFPLLLLPLLIKLQLFTYVFCSFILTYFVTNIITSCSFILPYISLLSVLYFPLSIFFFFLSQHRGTWISRY